MDSVNRDGRLSRRVFVRHLALVGLAGAVLPSLLTACQTSTPAATQPAAGASPQTGAQPSPTPAATSNSAPAQSAKRTLTLSLWGGITEDGVKAHVQPAFEKQTGATLAYDIGGQGARYNKLLAQKNTPTIDVFFSADEAVVAGHRAGVLMPATKKNIPNLAEVQDWAFSVKDFTTESTVPGAPYTMIAYGLAYNPARIKDPPKAWADMWRPEFRGKLAFAAVGHSQMPAFVILAAEMAGGSATNVGPGFAKLAELKPAKLTFFWTDWAPLDKSGEVTIATEFDYYVQAMKDQKYPIEWAWPSDKAIATPEYISIVKGSKQQELAEAFMNLMIGPGPQEAFARETYQGPVNKTVKLEPAIAARTAYGENLARVRFFNPTVFADNRAAWTERMNTEVVTKWGTA